MQYKNILIAYLNDSKSKPNSKYLSIKNVSDEPIVIEPQGKVCLNMTPDFIRAKNPKMPLYSKSVKIEENGQEEVKNEDFPF